MRRSRGGGGKGKSTFKSLRRSPLIQKREGELEPGNLLKGGGGVWGGWGRDDVVSCCSGYPRERDSQIPPRLPTTQAWTRGKEKVDPLTLKWSETRESCAKKKGGHDWSGQRT